MRNYLQNISLSSLMTDLYRDYDLVYLFSDDDLNVSFLHLEVIFRKMLYHLKLNHEELYIFMTT